MPPVRNVTVYCSSSNDLNPAHYEVARRFGELLAKSGRGLVYGGGCVGIMGEIARACRGAGGRVIGIITERLKAAEQMDAANDENVVVTTMRERKAILESRGDAMVILPGGLGTLEEFFEILVGRLLGEHDKPIVILNPPDPDGPNNCGSHFFDPMLTMIDHIIRSRFAKEGVRSLYEVVDSPERVIAALNGHEGRPARSGTRAELFPSAAAQGTR